MLEHASQTGRAGHYFPVAGTSLKWTAIPALPADYDGKL